MPTPPTGPQTPQLKPVSSYIDPGTGKTVYRVRGAYGLTIETTRLRDVQVMDRPFKGVDWKPKPKLDVIFGPPPPATPPPKAPPPPPSGPAPQPKGGGATALARGAATGLLTRAAGPPGLVVRTAFDSFWVGQEGMKWYLKHRDNNRPPRFQEALKDYAWREKLRMGGYKDAYRPEGGMTEPYIPNGTGFTEIETTVLSPLDEYVGPWERTPWPGDMRWYEKFRYQGYLKRIYKQTDDWGIYGLYTCWMGEFSEEPEPKRISQHVAAVWQPYLQLLSLKWFGANGLQQDYTLPSPTAPASQPPPSSSPDSALGNSAGSSSSPTPGVGPSPTGTGSSAGTGSSPSSGSSPFASPSPGAAPLGRGTSPTSGSSASPSGATGTGSGTGTGGQGSSGRAPVPSPATAPLPNRLPFAEPTAPLPAPDLKPPPEKTPEKAPEGTPAPNPNDLKQPDNPVADAINLAAKLAILAQQTSKKAIVEAVEQGTCSIMQPGKCGDEAIKRNNNDLLNKLGLGAQAADLTLLAVINSKLGPEVPGGISGALGRVSNIVRKTWDFLQVDRILNVLTFWVTLHNAMMLSNNLAQTLFSTAGNLLAVFGIGNISEDGTVTPFDVSTIVNQWLDNFFKGVFGAENYSGMKAEWKKWNRIYQAAANVVWSVQSIAHSILSVLEIVGSHISKIGNALRKWGVVGDRAYGWMNPQPNYQNRFFTALEKTEEVVSQVNMVSSEILSAQEAVNQIGKQKEDILRSVGQTPDQQGATIKPGPGSPDASQVKAQEDAAKANSQAVSLGILDLIKPEG